ncbi:SRPBCC family protein [Seonamhaeicola maritimus]|uniref:SRPBCC domain-containing protein n=1 Tax=Seonamhaeicola maritimus TaxID=2591822 RepID=A0A5C7GHS6_9FLAO|nr:SRPBCC domain-containing protein [Seonamhaeicola maritimus]TXG36755.1 SRPBCC domain-containing protein [Seonamhaeicola maritimus]
MKDVINKEHVFNHTIDKVWSAITNADEISTWFLAADFKPEAGYKYTFKSKTDHCEPIFGEVKEANPYKLVYTWIVTGTEAVTTVTWNLVPVENGTKLYLEHSGISKYEGETAIEMFESFNGGWTNCVNRLTDYLKELVNAG